MSCNKAPRESRTFWNERRLKEFIEDAAEWGSAKKDAAREKQTDWQLLCSAADEPCPNGDTCIYAKAACDFFAAHAASFSAKRLAFALRAIIIRGPSKEDRVPFLVGATNTGKSTIVESFDELFGEGEVFHLPAETDNKGFVVDSNPALVFLFRRGCKPPQLPHASITDSSGDVKTVDRSASRPALAVSLEAVANCCQRSNLIVSLEHPLGPLRSAANPLGWVHPFAKPPPAASCGQEAGSAATRSLIRTGKL